MLALGMLGAIQAAPGQQAGQLGDADAEHLPGQNVVHPRFQLRHLLRQPRHQTDGDLAQEDTGLRAGVQKAHRAVRPDVSAAVGRRPRFGQRVQHSVCELGRGENLVVREVRDACQNIRVATAEREAGLGAHTTSLSASPSAANWLNVIGG